MRTRLLAACFGVAAAACLVVAYLNRNSDIEGTVEGAYFDEGEGWTSYGPLESSLFEPFDPWDGYLWLGAGIAFLLAALVVLMFGRFARRSASAG